MGTQEIHFKYNDYRVFSLRDGSEISIFDESLEREVSFEDLIFRDLYEVISRINDWVEHYAFMEKDYVDWLNNELKLMRNIAKVGVTGDEE